MLKISGTYAEAAVYSDTAEDYAIAQIKMICDNAVSAGSRIAVMPDVHPGKVGPIGLTMTVGESIIPSLLGVDIGCGVSYIKIRNKKMEFQKLDTVIRECIPAGAKIRKNPHPYSRDYDFSGLICKKHIDEKRCKLSLGTLGSGNHFIEIDKDEEGSLYVFVHSGSRRLGKEVTEYYLKEGQQKLKEKDKAVPYELTCLEGQLMKDYLHDVKEAQGYAMLNREIILSELAGKMKWKIESFGESIHNYVDEKGILRKGAADAYAGDEVIIPINMKDGIILAEGKGNPDWNFSAPHGAGRVLSREAVRNSHILSEFQQEMKGIYSSSISKATLDEAPFAYRRIDEILHHIGETVTVKKILQPVYNFKAGGKE